MLERGICGGTCTGVLAAQDEEKIEEVTKCHEYANAYGHNHLELRGCFEGK